MPEKDRPPQDKIVPSTSQSEEEGSKSGIEVIGIKLPIPCKNKQDMDDQSHATIFSIVHFAPSPRYLATTAT